MIGLAGLIGLLIPSPLGAVKRATGPNPFAPHLVNQSAIATVQGARAGLVGPFDAITGSEADYPDEQATGRSDVGGWIRQDIPAHAIPPSVFHPNLPRTGSLIGDGTGPQTGYNKGWVILGPRRRRVWGGVPRVAKPITSTLLDPLERAPLPDDMAAAFIANNKGATRLEDTFWTSGD